MLGGARKPCKGRLVGEAYPNGMRTTRTFDAAGNPTGLEYIKTSHCTTVGVRGTAIMSYPRSTVNGFFRLHPSTVTNTATTRPDACSNPRKRVVMLGCAASAAYAVSGGSHDEHATIRVDAATDCDVEVRGCAEPASKLCGDAADDHELDAVPEECSEQMRLVVGKSHEYVASRSACNPGTRARSESRGDASAIRSKSLGWATSTRVFASTSTGEAPRRRSRKPPVPGMSRAIFSVPPAGNVHGSRASDSRQRSSMSIGTRSAAWSARSIATASALTNSIGGPSGRCGAPKRAAPT